MAEETPTPKADAEQSNKPATEDAATAAKEKAKDETPKDPWEEKPATPSHADAGDDPEVTALADALEGAVLVADRFAGQLTITVAPDRIVEICSFLKQERGYTMLTDLTAVDWPEREEGRFDVVYWLHRFDDQQRLRLVTSLPCDQPIASVTGVWRAANWMEREAYDMFGITFEGHPNLERILTWEAFHGHPLRKDFPVEGIDTGAAIYNEVYPPGGGPLTEEEKGRK